MSKNSINNDADVKPWYKQIWPWFIISIPATSIVLGVNMFYLALTTNNSLVVDDYYKQGKAINSRIERDKNASRLGLSALVSSSDEGVLLQLEREPTVDSEVVDNQVVSNQVVNNQIVDSNAINWPDTLSLRWIHVTQAHKDGATFLQHLGQGRYLAPSVHLPDNGRWRIHVQPAESPQASIQKTQFVADWRLVSEQISLSVNPELAITSQKYPAKVSL